MNSFHDTDWRIIDFPEYVPKSVQKKITAWLKTIKTDSFGEDADFPGIEILSISKKVPCITS